MQTLTASCQCGALHLTTTGPPKRVGICHCHECRKHHGALFYAAAIFAQDVVTIVGASRAFQGRHFCPTCGSSVFARSDDEVEVHLGAIETPNSLVPTYECWAVRRADWLPAFPGTEVFQRNREKTTL